MKNKVVRRTLSVLAVSAMVLGMAGCGGNSSSGGDNASKEDDRYIHVCDRVTDVGRVSGFHA